MLGVKKKLTKKCEIQKNKMSFRILVVNKVEGVSLYIEKRKNLTF